MRVRLEMEGNFFRYMDIDNLVQEIRIPVPLIPNCSIVRNENKDKEPSMTGFVELIFIDNGYSEIDGYRTYKFIGARK